MKAISFLSRLALVGVCAFAACMALNLAAGAAFALTASTLVLLIGARDYAPRRFALTERALAGRRENMPLAA